MKRIFVVLFCISIIFSDTIKYLEMGEATSVRNSAGVLVTIPAKERIVTIKNVRIDKITEEGVIYIEEKVTSSELGAGGIFISIAAIIPLIINNSENLDITVKEYEKMSNISLLSLLLGGLSIAANKMNFSYDKKGIRCENIIEIKDANDRLIEFNCKNKDISND